MKADGLSLRGLLPDFVFRLSREGRFLELGLPSDGAPFSALKGFQGKTLGDVLPGQTATEGMIGIRRALETQELQVIAFQFGPQHWEARILPWDRQEVLAVVRSLANLPEAVPEAVEGDSRLQHLTDAIPAAICRFQVGADGRPACTLLSGGGLELSGYEADHLREDPELVWSLVVPEDRAAVRESFLAATRGPGPWAAEFRIQTQDGQSKWVRASFVPEAVTAEGMTAWNGLFTDISERKRAEADRAENERRAQEILRHETLGALAGGVAQNFNNLLTAIIGNASLARVELPADSAAIQFLEQVQTASLRAADICKQMITYAGEDRAVGQRLSLNALVEDAASTLNRALERKAMLHYDLAPELPAVYADVGQVRRLLTNLVINASEALDDNGGTILVSTGWQEADGAWLDEVSLTDEIAEGRYVFLKVQDTGSGMDEDTLLKIFNPFFSTKFLGRGLGLAVAQGIARAHQGALRVESEPGRGSTFTLLLPAVSGPGEAFQPLSAPPSEWQGAGRVLVADDDPEVRAVTGKMLKSFGFTVALAADGADALAQFRDHAKEFRFILLDMSMPRMDGETAFAEIRRLSADIPVLFMSGFREQDALLSFKGQGLTDFIQKPFTAETLRGKLEAALAGPSEA